MENELQLEFFLNTTEAKRFLVLKTLNQDDMKTISIKQISLKLGLSERTTKKVILDIQSDIENFGYEKKISLDFHSGNNNKIYCTLHCHDRFSIHSLLRRYVETSIFFLIIKDLLFESSLSIAKMEKKYFVTNSTLRRYFKKIDRELNAFNLGLDIKKNLIITGDEEIIRIFYTTLFSEVYGVEKWPFSYISATEVDNCLKIFSPDAFFSIEHSIRNTFQLFFAISILRINKKQKIKNRSLFFTYQNTQDKEIFMENISTLKRLCPSIPKDQLEIEVAFIQSLVLSYGPYPDSDSDSHLRFFMQNSELEKNKFYDKVLLWILDLKKFLYKPLTLNEEKELTYATCFIFYRSALLNGFNISPEKNWGDESSLDSTFIFQVELLRTVIEDVAKKRQFDLNSHFLKFYYIEILFACIDITKFMPPINLVIITTLGESLKKYIMNYSNLYTNFNLPNLNNTEEILDVVVSNRPISKQKLSYSVSEHTKYFLWQDFPTKKNFEDLKNNFILICKKKFPFDFE